MSVGTNGNLPKRKPPGSRPIVTAATLPPGGGRPLVEHIDTFVARVQAYFSKLYLNPDEAYKQTRDHGASMRRDPVVMEPLRQRQLATALLDFQICPEDEGDVIQKAVCEDLKLCVQRTPYWTKMLMCLQEAIWFGKYAVNVYGYHWDRFNPWRMLPGEWIPVHGDKLKFEHETGRVGIRISSLANLSDRSDFRIEAEGRVVMVPDEWLSAGDRKALIVHKHEIEDGDFFDATTAGSIHGVGLRTRVYWPWFFKQKAVQWLMSWAEQVGLGVKIWYFEQSNPESEAAVRRAAEQNNENMNILMPRSIGTEGQGAGLELLEPSSGGAQFLQDLADKYWGDQIKRMIVGQTLTSQTAPTGMGSEVGKQHRETFDQLVKYDALNLAETISQQMLSVLVDYGYPGITWEPRFEFVLEEQDPRELMEAAKLFIDMGGEASEDEIRDIAGLKKPQKGEKVLGGKAALAAQQPPMPPGGEIPPTGDEPKEPLNLDALAAERQGEPERFSASGPRHAPAGGIIIHGKRYEGGEWIPSDVIDRMTDKQRAVLDAHGQPPGNAESPLKDVPDGDYELWESSHEGFTPTERTSEGKGKDRVSKFSGIDGELDEQTRKRLDAMKSQIPPSWTGIEISNDPESDILVYAKDKKGETKYVYHPKYQARQHAAKFERVYQFMHNGLEQFRSRATADMTGPDGPTKEAALVLYLQDKTGFRIDSGGAAGRVKAYGASSLESQHVTIDGDTMHFDFIGKEGVRNTGSVTDPFLAKEMAERKAKGGKLFKTSYPAITKYFKKTAGDRFLIKDLRTIKASETALSEINRIKAPTSVEEFHAARKRIGEAVAEKLNHTVSFKKDKLTGEKTPIMKDGKPYRDPGMALDNYIPPEVFSEWQLNLLRNGISIRLLGDSPKTPATPKRPQPKAKTGPAGGTRKKAGPIPNQTQQPIQASKMTWGEFSSHHFARRKTADGQQSLAWDESEHPRDNDGKFAEKGTATAEPDEPFSLTNKPSKPTPKSAEAVKDTSEQDHLFAGSDWKPGQEELFDPDASESEKPKKPHEMSRDEWKPQEKAARIERNTKMLNGIKAFISAGNHVVLRTQTKGVKLAKPEYLRLSPGGEVQIPQGRQWVTLLENQSESLARQAGVELPAKTKGHFDHVSDAIDAGKVDWTTPLGKQIAADYPYLAPDQSEEEEHWE